MSHLISTIAFTEPEHGPNMDLLGTSPKASLGQYTSWQEWGVLGACGPWEFFSDLLLPVWTEVPGDRTSCLSGVGPEIEAVAAALTEGTSKQALGGWCPRPGVCLSVWAWVWPV